MKHGDFTYVFIYSIKKTFFDKKYETLFKDTTFRMQVLDFLIYLPDDILTKVYRASMNNSLEVRVPFLDNNVIEHAFSLEKKNKMAVPTNRAGGGTRTKQSFSIPLTSG